MLPPGHIAAGYLVAKSLLAATHPLLTNNQTNLLLFAGTFFGFAPDLDMFYAFARARGFTLPGTKINHREFITHRPIVWLVAGLIIFFLASSTFWKLFGILVWLGSWSHFALDSLHVGIMWLWPFSNTFYAWKMAGVKEENNAHGFWNFWITFLKHFYVKAFTETFILEIIILTVATVVLFH